MASRSLRTSTLRDSAGPGVRPAAGSWAEELAPGKWQARLPGDLSNFDGQPAVIVAVREQRRWFGYRNGVDLSNKRPY
jgi:hypothetical protein